MGSQKTHPRELDTYITGVIDGLKTTFPCNRAMQEGAPQSQY